MIVGDRAPASTTPKLAVEKELGCICGSYRRICSGRTAFRNGIICASAHVARDSWVSMFLSLGNELEAYFAWPLSGVA